MSLGADGKGPPLTLAAWTFPDYLQEISSVTPHLVAELVELFLRDAAADLEILNEQTKLLDAEAAAMTLHSLKGSSRQIGGLAMGDLLEAMEDLLRWHGVEAIRDYLPVLGFAFQSLRTEMEYWIVRLADPQYGS